MWQNYSLGLEIQTPQEYGYNSLELMSDNKNNLKDFLKKNYKFPSDNLDEINEYIEDDQELSEIIHELPQIISKEFQKSPILLDFMDYALHNEIALQISIKTPYDGETSSKKLDNVLDEIFKFKSPVKYYFITMDF